MKKKKPETAEFHYLVKVVVTYEQIAPEDVDGEIIDPDVHEESVGDFISEQLGLGTWDDNVLADFHENCRAELKSIDITVKR
jgi:hypothetical protein